MNFFTRLFRRPERAVSAPLAQCVPQIAGVERNEAFYQELAEFNPVPILRLHRIATVVDQPEGTDYSNLL